MRKKLTAALLIFMLLLSACGRGGEVTAPPENMEAEGEGAQAQAVPAEEAKLSAAYVPREIAFPPELKKCDFWASLGDSLWFAGRDSEGGFLLPQYKFVGTITRKGKMSLVGYSYAVWLQRGILLSENVSPDHQLWSMFLLILIQKKKPSPGQKPPKKA